MLTRKIRHLISTILCMLLGLGATSAAIATADQENADPSPRIDIVIALDVSGSMSGLIASAKQRLWDIVNLLGRAQPQPELRIAIMSYGNPEYGADSGYVRIDLPFTRDLDAVNQTLFSFGTSGGDEYVARVVDTAIKQLTWNTQQDSLRILFVAGNESATQDPQISVQQATRMANASGIVVNTIYCGDDNDNHAAGWRDVATMTNGLYASIDQHSAAVANIATPMDHDLSQLNEALNDTYIVYGHMGEKSRKNQINQDANAYAMSPAAAISRVVTKAGILYDASGWDLVDALESGSEMADIEVAGLPEEMQSMNVEEREKFVAKQAQKREELQAEIQDLGRSRRAFIENERQKRAADAPKGLDEVIQEGLKSLAEEKGFRFEDE